MELSPGQLMGMMAMMLVTPTYYGWRNWRWHKQRQRLAAAQGWRYRGEGWRALFLSDYSMAGITAKGIVWTLRRTEVGRQQYLYWRARPGKLPYGKLVVVPVDGSEEEAGAGFEGVRPWVQQSEPWRSAFRVLATHAILVERYANGVEMEQLPSWPRWPEAGALEDMVWTPEHLTIRVRYQHEWAALQRLVTMGVAMLEQADQV